MRPFIYKTPLIPSTSFIRCLAELSMLYYRKLKFWRSVMYCNYCGVDNPDYAKFCRNCSRQLLRETNTPTILCNHCRTSNPAEANFCWQCGKRLQRETALPLPDIIVPPLPGMPTPGVPLVQGTPQAG